MPRCKAKKQGGAVEKNKVLPEAKEKSCNVDENENSISVNKNVKKKKRRSRSKKTSISNNKIKPNSSASNFENDHNDQKLDCQGNSNEENGVKSVPVNQKLPSKVRLKAENVDCNWKKLSLMLKKSDKPKRKLRSSNVKKENEIWFDDVDDIYLEKESNEGNSDSHLVKPRSFSGLTKIIGMDCEMVGVGLNGETSMLARVSIVNHFGHCVYDKYVKCSEEVTDYRTHVSGITPVHLDKGEKFTAVQQEVSDMFEGRILVGHALSHDLKVLYLSHPRKQIRDTAKLKKFRNMFGGRTPSLRNLSERLLGVKIQDGEHSSVQDAQAAVRLYTMYRKEWEATINKRRIKLTETKDSNGSKNAVK